MAECKLGVNEKLIMPERSKSKKKKCKNSKNKRHDTEEEKTETVAENIVYEISKKNNKSDYTGINIDVESQDDVLDKQGPSKKKKKKKGSKSVKVKGSQVELNSGEVEDVAESVDSGCIADSNSDIAADLTDWPQVMSALKEENKFITNFLKWLPVKKVYSEETAGRSNKREREEEEYSSQKKIKGGLGMADLDELQEKYLNTLANLKSIRKKKLWDPATRRKEAKLNKKLNRLKKRKTKRVKKNTKLEKLQLESEAKENGFDQDLKPQKPIYNKKGQLVFSKFDFSNDSTSGDIDTSLKPKDLKQLLSQALKEKEKVKRMEQKGETEKAAGVIEQKAWSGALQKAEGLKVRNDIDLIKKSIKKKESCKKTSQKNWEQRKEIIEKKKEEKQNARKKNIKARKETKLNKKMKKMKMKGHIVPGF